MEDFKNYLQSKNLRPRTIKEYQQLTNRFIQWYGDDDIINCLKKDILNYLSHLKNNTKQQNIARYNSLIAIRHYFNYLMDIDLINLNPTAFIKLRGLQKKQLHYIYNLEELDQLLDNFYHLHVKTTQEKAEQEQKPQYKHGLTLSYKAQMRKYIALQFIVYQGLRSKEVLNLKISDIDFTKATVHVEAGTQRGNARTLPLDRTQIGVLIQYINTIHANINPSLERDKLFISVLKRNTKNVSVTGLTELSQNLRKIDKKYYSLAQIRASLITHWIKTYGLRKAQYLAGHRSITSTEKYVPNDIEDLADDITKFNPF